MLSFYRVGNHYSNFPLVYNSVYMCVFMLDNKNRI